MPMMNTQLLSFTSQFKKVPCRTNTFIFYLTHSNNLSILSICIHSCSGSLQFGKTVSVGLKCLSSVFRAKILTMECDGFSIGQNH